MKVFAPLRIPPFDGTTEWLNSEPLGPDDLDGHVVLIDFWTLTCINWIRQVPYVRAWSKRYRADGLVVIGVHTPEFSFERDTHRVRRAVADRSIDYPVAIDNDYAIWSALSNHYWPALYFVDGGGAIRDFHYGEGRYPTSERVIQKLLGIDRDLTRVEGIGVEAPAAWHTLRSTETYLGDDRTERFASPGGAALGERRAFQLPDRLRSDHWAIDGEWTVDRETIVLEQGGGSISYRFHARDAHLVVSTRTPGPIRFQVLLDGEAPGTSHGADIDEHGNGVVDGGRLYQLLRQQRPIRSRVLKITFLDPGAEAYAFSFG